ncbi:NAD(P)H-dependent oxidoreductase, partial [Streptomyces tricolor]|nr:NAD(P)H-dependent oxidoreductase [Streptomyces tricolor]
MAELRAAVGAADALLIVTPEYAHGTSGVLKNALEWLVGGGEIAAKPVALASASPAITGGDRARAWLAETLTVMGAQVIPQDLRIPQATLKIARRPGHRRADPRGPRRPPGRPRPRRGRGPRGQRHVRVLTTDAGRRGETAGGPRNTPGTPCRHSPGPAR